jgi:hypothetical protein
MTSPAFRIIINMLTAPIIVIISMRKNDNSKKRIIIIIIIITEHVGRTCGASKPPLYAR